MRKMENTVLKPVRDWRVEIGVANAAANLLEKWKDRFSCHEFKKFVGLDESVSLWLCFVEKALVEGQTTRDLVFLIDETASIPYHLYLFTVETGALDFAEIVNTDFLVPLSLLKVKKDILYCGGGNESTSRIVEKYTSAAVSQEFERRKRLVEKMNDIASKGASSAPPAESEPG